MVVDGVLYSRIERQRGQKSSMAYAIAVGALLCTIGILVYTMVGYLLLV
jgi:tetrahydromethanopterin S-methyltransferase subunit G